MTGKPSTTQHKQPAASAANRKANKTERCLMAAREVFTRHGYGAASMDEVAAAAQISKATVYAHFGSKKDLFAAMMRRECGRCMEQMAIPAEVHELDLEPALHRIAASFLAVGLDEGVLEILRTAIAESPRFPELGEVFYKSGPQVTLAGVVAYLDRACQQGALQINDTTAAATQFLGMLRGDVQMRALLGLPVAPAEAHHMVVTAVAGFLAAYQA